MKEKIKYIHIYTMIYVEDIHEYTIENVPNFNDNKTKRSGGRGVYKQLKWWRIDNGYRMPIIFIFYFINKNKYY